MVFYRCPAFWQAARQILCAAALIVSLGSALPAAEANAQSPAPNSAVQIIDTAGLSNVVDLDGPWRFHDGDDPRFADPAFDDSSWPSIRLSQTLPPVPGGDYVWARVRLRVPTNTGRLALAVYPSWFVQYEVFANGAPAASTPGMATRTLRNNSVSSVALPPAEDIVLAIRCYRGDYRNPGLPLPFWRASVGSFSAIQTASDLFRLQRLLGGGLFANYAWLPMILLLGLTALILYRAQRDHDEYLWYAVSTFLFVLSASLATAIVSGGVPFTWTLHLVAAYAGSFCVVTQLEFVMRFTRISLRWPIRILQAAVLIEGALNVSPSAWKLLALAHVMEAVAVIAAETFCLFSAFRRGMKDSAVLLVTCAATWVINLASHLAAVFPTHIPWGTDVHIGPVHMYAASFSSVPFSLGITAVLLYRFIRVARDEQRAAAELEAARTVQQILVPEEIATIPGFFVEAVYHPAGQVGGDFYQVLPTQNGGLLAVIGDVSGKGMPAAMTVSLLVGIVRTLAHYTQDPAEILTAMNQRLIGRSSGFTTALVLRLDRDGTLTAANAGHIAPYANGKELAIDNSLPLGITATAAYVNSTLHLEANTTLTLLTDGVVEAQNAKGELFGFDRAAQISSKPAQTVAEAAQAFGQEDDITVLSLALVVGG